MTSKANEAAALLELAERCEAAEGPDIRLDADICDLIRPDGFRSERYCDLLMTPSGGVGKRTEDGVEFGTLPAYTASLDAAMTLVPEGWSVGVGHLPGRAWLVRAHLRDHRLESLTPAGHSQVYVEGHNAAFALALCAAALRARATTLPQPMIGDEA